MYRVTRALPPRDERGAAAVEFALVVPLLLMLLFGMISTGRTYSDHLAATNAVREGARYGAAANIASTTWTQSVKDRVKAVYFNAGDSAPADDQICVRLLKADGTTYVESLGANCGTAPVTTSLNMAAGSCAVLVWMQRPATIQLIAFPNLNFNIGASSVAYYSRKAAPTCIAS